MTDVASFKIRYPEFVGVGDPIVQFHLDDALVMFDQARWGNLFDKGHAALTAHELKLYLDRIAEGDDESGGDSSFPVASKSVGDVSVSFATPQDNTGNDAYYNSTSYGQTYLNLMKMVGIGAVAVV